jgi:hypothetical protein
MRVLIDVHHSDLMESLHRLFADRLGADVRVPYGLEWRDAGYWRFGQGYPDGGLGVAKQFLLMPAIDDLQPHRVRNMTTLEEAQDLDWDVVIASVPDNYDGYHRFAQEHGARFAIQVGNVNQPVDWSLKPLVFDATGVHGGVPFTPEWDIDGAFRYSPPTQSRWTRSFVNLFPQLPCFPQMMATADVMLNWSPPYGSPPWTFQTLGHGSPTFVKPTSGIAALMRECSFGWHDKVTGDGFGYVIHYWASVGRPLIGHASHYRNQTAADLWEDGVTCIDLDLHTPAEAAHLMEEIVSDPARHAEMCWTISQRVRARVDFAADAERVADALGMLVAA